MKRFIRSTLTILLLCCFSSGAFAVCSNNEDGQAGVAGEIEYFTATNKLMYCDDTDWVEMTYDQPILPDSSTDFKSYLQFFANGLNDFFANDAHQFFVNGVNDLFANLYHQFFVQADPVAEYVANAVNFDGTSDYLTSGASLTGVTDDKEITLSFWYKLDSYPSSGCHSILGSNPSRVSVQYCGNGTETMQLTLRDTSGALNTNIGCGPDPHILDTWYHHLISVDTATGTANCYVNDANSLQAFTSPTDAVIDFTLSDFGIGASTPGSSKSDGDLADVWIDFGTYIDLSVEANRRKFISAAGNPVDLGSDGSVPTSSAPDIFLSGDTATWHTNDGTGGGFTENGALTDGVEVTPPSILGWWKLDETSGTIAADSSPNGYDASMSVANASARTRPGVIQNSMFIDDSTNGIITASGDIGLAINASNWSYGGWIFAYSMDSGMSDRLIMFPGPSGLGTAISLSNFGSDQARFMYRDGAGVDKQFNFGAVQLESWHHLFVTYDGTNFRTYVDGVETSVTSDTFEGFSGGNVNLGGNTAGNHKVDGNIDDIRIYNRAVSTTEVQAIYDEGKDKADLVGHWKLDETSGTTAVDSSVYGNDASVVDITFDAGSINGVYDRALSGFAYTGPGSETSGNISLPSGMLSNNSSYTFSGWIRQDDLVTNGYYRISRRTGGTDFIIDTSDRLNWEGITSSTLNEREWSFFSITFEHDTLTCALYLDGISQGTNACAARTPYNTLFTNLSWNFNGIIGALDDLRLYKRSLTSTEIEDLYNESNSALVGHWKLDETSGITAVDSSQYGNDGIITGADASARTTKGIINTSILANNTSTGLNLGEMPMTANSHSMAFWFYIDPAATGTHRIFSRNNSHFAQITDSDSDGIYTYDIRLRDLSGNGPGFCYHNATCEIFQKGRWYHLAIVSDVGNSYIYVDGALYSTGASADFDLDTNDLTFGISGESFDGKWDDIRIYNKALTATEIQELYNKANENLVGHWKLDETSGTTAVDSSQYGNDGTMQNGMTGVNSNVNAVIDTGLDFNAASNRHITAGTQSELSILGDVTLSAWINLDAYGVAASPGVVQYSEAGETEDVNYAYSMLIGGVGNEGDLRWFHEYGAGINEDLYFSSNILLNKWYHATFVRDATLNQVSLYLDGSLHSTQSYTNDATGATASQLAIGRNITSNANFDGQIDDVRVYDRMLTASEIQEIYNKANGSLVGHWKLDETSGTTAADSSQYGNDGTMQNGMDAGTSTTDAIVNTGFDFPGTASDESIDVPADATINIDAFSLSFWVNTNQTCGSVAWFNCPGFIRKADTLLQTGTGWHILTSRTSSTVNFVTMDGSTVSELRGNIDIAGVGWTHITVTRDNAGNKSVYINGILDDSGSDGGLDITNTGTLRIGQRGANTQDNYADLMDDVRLYNHVLTAAEILELYNKANENLIGHWKLDETSGTTAVDSSQYSNDGTMNGGLDAANDNSDGVIDTSLDFDGTGTSITIPHTSIITPGISDWTTNVWFKADDTDQDGPLIRKREPASPFNQWQISKGSINSSGGIDSSKKISFILIEDNSSDRWFGHTTNDVIDGNWHMVTALREGSNTPKIYIDGVEVAVTVTSSGGSFPLNINNTEDFIIGGNSGFGNTDGEIDDVRIYNRALTTSEIQKLYDQANGSLMGWWKMDETSGSTLNDSSAAANTAIYRAAGSSTTVNSTEGQIDESLVLDAESFNNINIVGNPDEYDMTDEQELTIAGWVYYNGIGSDITNYIFMRGNQPNGTTNSSYFLRIYSGGQLAFQYNDGSARNSFDGSGIDVPINEWAHVAVTWDGSDVRYYINGTLTETDALAGTLVDNATYTGIGGTSSSLAGSKFDGLIDDLRIYNRALSDAEIGELVDTGTGGLVAHYRLDETSGTTAIDSSVYGNDGTMNGGLDASNDRVDGSVGTALNFDGNDDYIEVVPAPTFLDNVSKFSICTWFKLPTTPTSDQMQLFSAGNGGDRLLFFFDDIPNPRTLTLLLDNDTYGTVAPRIDASITANDNWQHTCGTYNSADNLKLYLNGVLVSSLDATTILETAVLSANWKIGRRATSSNDFFEGDIDDMRVYTEALTSDQVLELYNAGDPPANGSGYDLNDGLVGYWALDETSGTTAVDSSGNGNDGTMTGSLSGAASTAGVIDTALNLLENPNSDRIDIPDTGMPIGTNPPFSMGGWFKLQENTPLSAGRWTLGYGDTSDGTNDAQIIFDRDADVITYQVGSTQQSSNVPNYLNKWMHVFLVFDGTTARLYKDGALLRSDAASISPVSSYGAIGGRIGGGSDYNGDIDDVRMYSRAISAAEVEILAGCTGPGVHYYNFSDNTLQWCDGIASAYDMGPKNSSGSGQCNAVFDQAEMNYSPSRETMYFCNASTVIPIGRSCVSCGGSNSEKVAFIRSTAGSGASLSGLSGADAKCQASAVAAGLSGTYYAWLADSDPNSAPAIRYSPEIRSNSYSIVMPDGTQIASDWSNLIDGNIDNNLDISELGGRINSTVTGGITTNVNTDGTQTSSTNTCSDYTSGTGNKQRGDARFNNSNWTNGGVSGCLSSGHIYCFEQ